MGLHDVLAAQIAGGGYLSISKAVVALLILLAWARLMTWVDRDAPAAHLPQTAINVGNVVGLAVAYALFFLTPSFWLGIPVLLLIAGAEAAVYLHLRKNMVGLKDLKRQFNRWIDGFRIKKKVNAAVGEIVLFNQASAPQAPPEHDSPERPGYDAVQTALADPLKKHADQVEIDSRPESGAAVSYMVDGMSYAGAVLDRAAAAAGISLLKDLAGLDVNDRRKPQKGAMRISMAGEKHGLSVQTAGSTAGEFMRLQVDAKTRHQLQLSELGLTERQLSTVKESISRNSGVVILSTSKGMGLTNLTYGVLRGHDAFLQHIQTVERDPEEDLEGITQNKLPANATADDEFKKVDWVISQEPDAIFLNKLEDPRSAKELIKFSQGGKRVYVAMRASSTFEALSQWRKLIGDDTLAMEALDMIVNGRVLRKLCINCKVAFAPDAAMLRKLGMNPEKAPQLFQARTEPQRDQKGKPVPCGFCHDLRYKGRTGVFEIMTLNPEIREAVVAGKPVEPIFRKQRSRYLQEEALALVESGDTSVQEVKRVLRPDAAATASAPPGSSGPPAAPRRASTTPARRS